MEFLRRLFGGAAESKDDSALEPFQIEFPNGASRPAVHAARNTSPQAIIDALNLSSPTPTIFVSGGASMMTRDSSNVLRSIIEDGLVRFITERQICLIDGGTASGVMQLIGEARQRRNSSFPLLGVAPDNVVSYPSHAGMKPEVSLDAYHSHFVLTSGDQFGSESETSFNLAYALSGNGAQKRLVMVLNGGEIVKKDAHRSAVHEPRFPLLVLEGSGRFADELAISQKNGSDDPVIRDILNQGTLYFLSVKAGADSLYHWLENFFGF